jgi:hypothetical protein
MYAPHEHAEHPLMVADIKGDVGATRVQEIR